MCKSVALDTANKLQDIIRLLTLRSVEEGDGEDVARLQPSSVRDADAREPAALRQPQPQEVRGTDNRNVRKHPLAVIYYGDSVTEAASY